MPAAGMPAAGMPANPKFLVVGARGMLGRMLCRQCEPVADVAGYDLPELDMTDEGAVAAVMAREKPDVVINCAAYTAVDACETNLEIAMKVNGDGAGVLARAAVTAGARFVHISTDYVFDGQQSTAYGEDDPTDPINAYGDSKLAGEFAVKSAGGEGWYILRTSWLFGPEGKNFVETIARLALSREELKVVDDQHGCPTYTEDLAQGIIALLSVKDAPAGIYHFTNSQRTTWHGFATAIVENLRDAGFDPLCKTLEPVTTAEFPTPAKRPGYSELSLGKFTEIAGYEPPPWRGALKKYMTEYLAPLLKAEG